MQSRLLTLFAAAVLCAFAVAHSVAAETATKTNVILILADDFGYECVAANGGTSYKTPNLDRLAAEGMRFEHCYAQPLCTPTRVQLLTGAYNIRNYTRFGQMDAKLTTVANLFQRAGYATAIAGKWQLGRDAKLPQNFGFKESCLWQHTRRPPRYANPGLEYNGIERDFERGQYGPDLVNDFALDFVARHKDMPFFLFYPMLLTHGPFQPTPDSAAWNPTARGEQASDRRHFADMVTYMDKLIGKLVARVDELGLGKNTLIVFVGDNGTARGIRSQFRGQPYRGGKGLTTAAGMHVPLLVRWSGTAKAGTVCGDLVDTTDFLPTLCAASGIAPPRDMPIDGNNFLPQVCGEKGEPRAWIYCWYSRDGQSAAVQEFAASKQLKLYRDGRMFDIAHDPAEATPLIDEKLTAEQHDDAKRLRSALAKYSDARPQHLSQSAENSH